MVSTHVPCGVLRAQADVAAPSALLPQRGRHLMSWVGLRAGGFGPSFFCPCGPLAGIPCSRLHGQFGVPGQLYGLPGGRRCKTSWGFVLGSSLDGSYSPPCGGRFFARALFDHWVGQVQTKTKGTGNHTISAADVGAPLSLGFPCASLDY